MMSYVYYKSNQEGIFYQLPGDLELCLKQHVS